MENKEITMIGLLNRIYNGNAPKKIKYKDIIFKYDEISQDYKTESEFYDDTNYLFCYLFRYERALDTKVEIIQEKNDEWEDIREIEILDFSKEPNDNLKDIAIIINQLIKNQKYLKERLDKDEEK